MPCLEKAIQPNNILPKPTLLAPNTLNSIAIEHSEMKICSLAYLGFNSLNLEPWRELATDILGLALGPDGDDGSIFMRMDDRRHRIAIHPGVIDEIAYIGWELRGRQEFEAALVELDAKEVVWEAGTPQELAMRGVSAMAHFSDPAGFRHEIAYGQEFEPTSFVPGRPISGFVADELGVGHVVLGVPEVSDEIRAFATDVLGFQIFAGYRAKGANGQTLGLEFYRCNQRSHCLAYVPTAGHRGVTHMCIETHSLDDVGRAWDMVQDRKVPIKMSLGRHTMDSLVSFYIRTPSGFELEYGAGGMMVDDDTFVMQKPRQAEIWGHKLMLEGWGSTVRPIDSTETQKTREG